MTARLLRLCGAGWESVRYVEDRKSNNIRYSMDWTKLAGLGYRPVRELEDGLAETVEWYWRNPDRWVPLLRRPAAPVGMMA